MTIKAILFDIDGTLVDSNDFHARAWAAAFAGEGHDIGEAVIRAQIGKGKDMLVPTLLPGSDGATAERLGKAQGALFKAHYLGRVRPFAGARDLLARAASAGQRVVLASSASREQLDHYLDLLDARGLVAAATSADDVERTKPAPDIFAAALGKLDGVGAGEAVVVGDTPYDVAAAAKCGMAAVALRSGGFDDASLAGAAALYDGPAALLAEYDRSPLGSR